VQESFETNAADVRSPIEKAEATEVEVGRVARIEVEVWALGTTPVGPAPTSAVPPPPSACNSAIVPGFPKLFEDFKEKEYTLLWRGSRDGFHAPDFHSRCDGHPNTLTVILDADGNIFGGFTPVMWETPGKLKFKGDPSLKSFVFTLKNPHNVPAPKFALSAEKKNWAMYCYSDGGPCFCDIGVSDNCNENTDISTSFYGNVYTNSTGPDGETFCTGSESFQERKSKFSRSRDKPHLRQMVLFPKCS
jgi:hypothetical protein